MAEINLKEQITNLAKLQTVDSEIYLLRKELEAKPEEIKQIDAAFEAKKTGVANSEKAILDLQKQRKDKEAELAAKEEAAKKLQSQLFSLKTNKEYQAMLQQIQDAKTDASVIEDKILVLFDQQDKAKIELEKEKQKLQAEEKASSELKKKIADRTKEINDRLAQLEASRAQAISGIDQKILIQYERILSNRDGLAIVTVEGGSCQGCNMSMPPQVINLIKMYESIITCEVCNRILYIGDENP